MVLTGVSKIVLVVCIVRVLQSAVLGCKMTSDCAVQTTTSGFSREKCCHHVAPARCMSWIECYLHRPTIDYGFPTYKTFTTPYYNPDYNTFYTIPNRPPIENIPTLSYDSDDYETNDHGDFSTGSLSGTIVAIIFMLFFVFVIRYLRFRQRCAIFQQACNVQRISAVESTSRTNVVPPGTEQGSESRRFVIIAITNQRDQRDYLQNHPPAGEPPFLSEEDIVRQSVQNIPGQEPPSYEELCTRSAEPQPPKYEDLVNGMIEEPPPYDAVQASSMNVSGDGSPTPQIQHTMCIPSNVHVEPPSYETA